jgi:hypothetical protein
MAQEITFSSNEELPHLNDERYIRFIQDYAANLSHNTRMVLRDNSKGFIACKFSVLSYLLISMVWVDDSLPTYEDKLRLLLKINFGRNFSKKNREKLNKPVFNDYYLVDLFMYNRRSSSHMSTEITEWANIRFEDGVAFFGIINPSYMGGPGEILHYFIVVQRTANGPYTIISSYGSDNVSYSQFETPLQKKTFIDFIRSLNKKVKSKNYDIPRIKAYMRYHFLNDKFMNMRQENQNRTTEINYYLRNKTIMVQFNNIYVSLRGELESRRIENNGIQNNGIQNNGIGNQNVAASGFDNENGAASGFDNETASNVEFKVAEIVTNTVADNAKRTRNNNINKQNKPKKTKKNVLNDIVNTCI